MDDPLAIALRVAEALEAAGSVYLIGGSLASGLYGMGRATMDADLVATLRAEQVEEFLAGIGPDFYADEGMILEAIERQGSFNLIHLGTMFKVDVFIPDASPFRREVFKRRRYEIVDPDRGISAYFASPEDLILTKLNWSKQAGGSERQWGDILGIMKAQAGRLDQDYLRRWAPELDVLPDLERALAEAGLDRWVD